MVSSVNEQVGITRCVPQEKSVPLLDNNYFNDQAGSFKMAGYWQNSLFAWLWTDTESMNRKRTLEYPAVWTSLLVDKPNICCY